MPHVDPSSPRRHSNRVASSCRAVALATWLAFAGPQAFAQPATGTVEGRVLNVSNGNYLNNARVVIEGTRLETLTNENGEYRLTNVPAGEARLRVTYTGLAPQTVTLLVGTATVARHDVELALPRDQTTVATEVLKLESFVVEGTALSAQASALHEQRSAPNIKNVVVLDEIGDLGDGNIGEYLKYVPGIAISFAPQTAGSASIFQNFGTLVTLGVRAGF